MKFIHIADVHLGATPDEDMPWGKDREKEIWESLNRIIMVCNEKQVDLLLISGDLFHKQPLVRELKEVNYIFEKLETAQVVLMAGNHDYIGPRSNYPGFKWNSKVHMFIKDTIETVEFPEINTVVHGHSYLTRDINTPIYNTVKPLPGNQIQILLAHGGDDKNIPFNRKLLLSSGFDYIALGHIHIPEIIGENVAYAGSLEPLHKNEIGERGYIFGEIDPLGEKQNKISFVPFSLREYKRLEIFVNPEMTNLELIDNVKDVITKQGKQNIFQFIIKGLRDEAIEFSKEDIIDLGNVLEVIDESLPDYDFDALYNENADNITGLFIKKIRENSENNVIAEKALYYGLGALLEAKDAQ